MAIAQKVKKESEVENADNAILEIREAAKRQVLVEDFPSVKQIVRYLSRQAPNPLEAHYSIAEVDAYVGSWVDQGYKLISTHYLGENPEGFGVLYILVRE